MRPEQFERLSVAVGRATSRRRALAILAGGVATAMVPLWRFRTAGAAETERAAAPVCNASNLVNVGSLAELDEYARVCGVACTPGDSTTFLSGAAGCTNFAFAADLPVAGRVSLEEDPFRGVCATVPVTVHWRHTNNSSAFLHVSSFPACCQAECDGELKRWHQQVFDHETAHRNRNNEIIAGANVRWTDKPFTFCGRTPELAQKALQQGLWPAVDRQVAAERVNIDQTQASDPEPDTPYERPSAELCGPASRCSSCRDGKCATCQPDKVCCPPPGPKWCCEPGWTCCPDPLRQAKNGCCDPGKLCCAPKDGGGCCPQDVPVCVFSPSKGAICLPLADAGNPDSRHAVKQTRARRRRPK